MSDKPPIDEIMAATLVQRLQSAGISDARELIVTGHVRMGDEVVTDPDCPAPWPEPYVLI